MEQLLIKTKALDSLVEGCRNGKADSQQAVYDLFAAPMFGVCKRYLKNPMEAEDALVNAFTRAFERISQYKGEGSFEGWLRRIVVNEALSTLRKNRAMMLHHDLESVENKLDYAELSDQLEVEDLLGIIQQLPPGYQVVFNMYAIDGYSHKEIAEHLGISENTSKSQLSRARDYLQKMLTNYKGWNNKNEIRNEQAT